MLCCFVFVISLSLTKLWTFKQQLKALFHAKQLFLYFSMLFLFCLYFFSPGTQLYLCQTFSECHSYLIKNFCWSFKFSIVIFSSSLSSVNLTLLAIHVSLLLVCAHFENEDVVIYSLMSTGFCSWSYYGTNFFWKIFYGIKGCIIFRNFKNVGYYIFLKCHLSLEELSFFF